MFALGSTGLAGYAVGVEPGLRPAVRRYAVAPPRWPAGLTLRIGVIADIHACEPWMPAERIRGIAEQCNALDPDLILLLGDFNAGHRIVTGPVMPAAWADALSVLRAPLGTYAILGNHDWWHGPVPGMPGGPEDVRRALRSIGVEVLENRAVPLHKDGCRFWLAGLVDLMSHGRLALAERIVADISSTLRQVRDDAPVIMLVHEPNGFRHMPDRVSLTLSGHTHGGQIVVPGVGPIVTPSRRYNYGHIVEDGRHLIVSGGLGESGVPARVGVPPEILDVALGGPGTTAWGAVT
jgi:predicted MPP superfamily phosphohydrolase